MIVKRIVVIDANFITGVILTAAKVQRASQNLAYLSILLQEVVYFGFIG